MSAGGRRDPAAPGASLSDAPLSGRDGRPLDLVVENAVVLTMDAERTVVHGWIGITDGVIAAVGTGPAPAASARIDARGGIVHPGYVSAHQHTMDTLARAADDTAQTFFDWLFGTYYAPVLQYTPADAARAARLAATDLARAGVTTLLDCWGVGEVGTPRADACLRATADVARASGLRWILAPMVSDRLPAEWDGALAEAEAAGTGFRRGALIAPTPVAVRFATDALALAGGRVDVWTSAELPEMASDRLLAALATAGPGFTTHLCASEPGAAGVPDADGRPERAVARLLRLGVFDRRTVGAHLTSTDAAERAALAAHGVGAAHCACSTMFGGGRHSALGELREAGVTVGLGLDNATLNTPADMVAEMRHALAFDRSAGSGSIRATARDALAMATIDGARTLGLGDRVGSIERGKRADLVLLDTSASHWQPPRDPHVAVVLQSRIDDIRLVLVDGEPVYER
jgi:5-methylthioadenosine/S-adenosylhomocysteine deaminase